MPAIPKEGQKPNVNSALNPTRKFAVRLSLATGATFATLIGAQTLALLDIPKTALVASPTTSTQNATRIDTVALPNVAPQIIVVRNAGTPAPIATSLPRRIVPPPEVVAPPADIEPAPVQPAPPSQSSR